MEEVRWYPNSSTADATRENTQTLIFIIHTSLNNNFSTPADAEIMVAAIPHLWHELLDEKQMHTQSHKRTCLHLNANRVTTVNSTSIMYNTFYKICSKYTVVRKDCINSWNVL